MRATVFAVAAIATFTSTTAFAQSDSTGTNTDSITIGIGAASTPRYEGSNDSTIVPAAAARGSISGVSFTTIATGLYVDVIPRREATGGKLLFGPVVHVTLDRNSRKMIRDPQIIALGTRDVAVELGGQVGYTQNGVITSDYDNLAISVAVVGDVASAHKSYIVTPSITYGTPLSTSTYVGVSAAAHYVGKGYAQTYFNVDGAQSLASGLPTYGTGDGFKDVTFSGLAALSLSGDLRRGFALFAAGSYARLLGDFKRSPIVRDSNQWYGGVGIGYTF